MRINVIGNALNLAFVFWTFLKKKGFEVKVFIDKKEPIFYLPQWEDSSFRTGELPGWIEIVDVDYKRFLISGRNEKEFIRQLADCDIIQSFGESVIWARRTAKPYVFLSYGDDLQILPFKKWPIEKFIYARILRDALANASYALYTMPQQEFAASQLRLRNSMYFPCAIPIDTDRYKPFEADKRQQLRQGYNCDFLFFHPARQEWSHGDLHNKGNDKLLRAFARFTRENKYKTTFVAVEKGRDVAKSKELADELGITENIKWIKPLDKRGLIEMFNIADICFDDFVYGFYGLITLEALSVGRATFSYLEHKFIRPHTPPVVNVFSEDDIYRNMVELTGDKDKLEQVNKKSRDWVLEYHRGDKVVDRYLELYEKALKEKI